MNESRWERYEAKRQALKAEYRSKKRKVLFIMLAIVAVAVAAMIAVCSLAVDVQPRMIALIAGVVTVALALIFGGQRVNFYVQQENTQLNLLEQDEPFDRFRY